MSFIAWDRFGSYLTSLGLHGFVVLCLLFLSRNAPYLTTSEGELAGGGSGVSEQQQTDAGADEGEESTIQLTATKEPFRGIPYSQFLKILEGKTARSNVATALSLLGGLKLKKSTGKGGAFGSATVSLGGGGFGRGTGTGNGIGMGNSIRGQRFLVVGAKPKSGRGGRGMSEAEANALRLKFRALEPEFRKIYLRALENDPALTVTVAFEAHVMRNGFLSVSAFRGNGTYQPGSLAKLEAGMSQIIGQVYVASDLVGTNIRGENVFVR